MNPAARADAIWQAARDAAEVILRIPCRAGEKPAELFLKRVPKTGPRGFRMGSRGHSWTEEPIHRVLIEQDFLVLRGFSWHWPVVSWASMP